MDASGSGATSDKYYIVRKYRDQFIPAITLSLAANYFGVKISDVDVVLRVVGANDTFTYTIRSGYWAAQAI